MNSNTEKHLIFGEQYRGLLKAMYNRLQVNVLFSVSMLTVRLLFLSNDDMKQNGFEEEKKRETM